MVFKKYNSIENSYQDDFLSSIVEQGFGDLEYGVQEKVHGTNLSFISNGQTIIYAKRTELILDNEEFFNSKLVKEKYTDNILELFKYISDKFNAKTITIFGELFGGGYPHPDIEKDVASKLVQGRISLTRYWSRRDLTFVVNTSRSPNIRLRRSLTRSR